MMRGAPLIPWVPTGLYHSVTCGLCPLWSGGHEQNFDHHTRRIHHEKTHRKSASYSGIMFYAAAHGGAGVGRRMGCSTAAAFAGGTGTAEDPYQIANGAQLAYLASSVNNGETYEEKNFVLTANIDLNELPWTPIANSFSNALFGGSDYRVFAGNFDGNGYTISKVSIGSETTPFESDVFGLFGATEGKISNLNLDTVSIHGVAKITSGYVIGPAGGLVGY